MAFYYKHLVVSDIINPFYGQITVTFPAGTVTLYEGSTVVGTASVSPHTFAVGSSGTFTVTYNDGTSTASKNVVISTRGQTASVAFNVLKAFNACTMDEINSICESDNASYYITNGIWTIGDTNSNATYGSYSGVRLVHVLTDEQRGADYYGTTGHIVVEFVNTITTSKWHSSYSTQTSYSASTLKSNLAGTIYNGLNSDFKSVLKTFAPSTSVQSSSSSSSATTSIEHPSGYLHVPNCVEVGSTNYYRPSENDKSFTFTYYSTDATNRRKKSGANSLWWLRSPSFYRSSYYRAYGVGNNGDVYDNYYVSNTYGVAPIGCI